MDRNQVIGFALLALLLIGYLTYNQHEQKVYLEQKKADSIAFVRAHLRPIVDSSKASPASQAVGVDSLTLQRRKSQPSSYYGEAQTITLANKKLSVQFSSKGAFPVAANLLEYKTSRMTPLYLFNGKGNQFTTVLPFDNGKSTGDLFFTPVTTNEPNGDKTVDFAADLGDGKKVDMIYTLPADDYMMRCSIVLTGITATSLPITWQTQGLRTEKDITNERMAAQVYFRNKAGDADYFTIREDKTVTNNATQWVGFRKQYFSTALIAADEQFTKMDLNFVSKAEDTLIVAQTRAIVNLPLKPGSNTQTGSMRMYIGPNDYHTLQSYKMDMDDMVPLGFGVMAFVKYVNKFALVPIFYFLAGTVKNYALVIVLMTLFIRLILSFFTYKSYLSSAKMRVMKPELDALREKIGDDQQKFSMEQMKLYRSAGVNPLGGCLPMLFQLPILLSMYYMFPNFIEFRQQSFLWCHDLSTYDSIFNFGFSIPAYGDHISLFTLMMTGSSLFLAVYNRNMTPQDPNNPMMKYMPYIFPVILMGVFNKMAAALTFYYTFSNLLSIAQQFIIQKYFINEAAIHAQLQENKTKPVTQNKWAAKFEEMQKQQTDKNKTTPRINKKN